jgi:hypothetical protein
MSKLLEYILIPDANLSAAENMFLVGIFIREEVKNTANLTIHIPKSLFESITNVEFNDYFSDLLLDANFKDSKIQILIQEVEKFRLLIHEGA